MKFEDQVCSLELAIKLKELGVKQESLFFYAERLTGYHSETEWKLLIHDDTTVDEIKNYSAFTPSELLELLPCYIHSCFLEIIKGINLMDYKPKYCARYYDASIIGEPDENLANACAKMLIHLLENNLWEIK